MPYTENIDFIADGELVKASVAGRPDRVLHENVKYLKTRLDQISAGEALFDYDVSVSSATKVGMPVYWNSTNNRYEPAQATYHTDTDAGVIVPDDAADVIGIVYAKSATSETLADILILGRAEVDISEAVDGSVTSGRYYLSATEAGKLVKYTDKPAVTAPVLFATGTGHVYVSPYVKDFVDAHTHYSFELEARPAAQHIVPNDPSERHYITSEDTAIRGWLKASNAVFEGKAPYGAAFGYNLSAHPELAAVWPPIPVEAANIVVDRGDGGVDVPIGTDELVALDANGIWWMSDCYGDVPWPTEWTGPVSESSSNSANPECPRYREMRIVLNYARMGFATDKNVVTSITAPAGGPIRILDQYGESASRGALQLVYDPALSNPFLPFDVKSTSNVTSTSLSNVTYLSMPAGQASTIYGYVRVPSVNLPDGPRIRLRLTLLAKSSGTSPNLTIGYRRLPITSTSHAAIPSSETAVTANTSRSVGTDRYFTAETDTLSVAAGDVVYFSLARSASDGYAGALGLIDQVAILSGTSS